MVAGAYRIDFFDPDDDFIPATYRDTAGAEIEVPLPAPDSTVTGIDESLEVNGRLSGTVTGPDGSPISGIAVLIFHWFNNQWEPYEDVYGLPLTNTGGDGTYTLRYLKAGTYRIFFSGGRLDSFAYRNEYYNDASTLDAAQDIVITNQNYELTGFDATMGVLPTPEIIDFSRTAPSHYSMRVRVASGHRYRLLSSPDLDQWLANRGFTASSDEEVLTLDSNESDFPERFWKIDIAR